MNTYGKTAITAVDLLAKQKTVEEAWDEAVKQHTSSESSRKKGCPRSAFIGLYESGAIKGYPKSTKATKESPNKEYALLGLQILKENQTKKYTATKLWELIKHPQKAQNHNGQMSVVLALWEKKLLN